jgi:Protein of unknown function (DUF2892)
MQKNVSPWDAILRITFGLVGLAWSTSTMIRHPLRGFPWLVAILSAMKVAEGVTRYCPIISLFKRAKQSKQPPNGFDSLETHI